MFFEFILVFLLSRVNILINLELCLATSFEHDQSLNPAQHQNIQQDEDGAIHVEWSRFCKNAHFMNQARNVLLHREILVVVSFISLIKVILLIQETLVCLGTEINFVSDSEPNNSKLLKEKQSLQLVALVTPLPNSHELSCSVSCHSSSLSLGLALTVCGRVGLIVIALNMEANFWLLSNKVAYSFKGSIDIGRVINIFTCLREATHNPIDYDYRWRVLCILREENHVKYAAIAAKS